MTADGTGQAGLIVKYGTGPHLAIGAQTILTGRASWTNGAYSVMDQLIGAKVLAPPHFHELEDQASIVLEGELGFWIDGEEFVAGPGDYVFRPAGKPHALWNAGDEVARMQEITSPGANFEEYMTKLSEMIDADVADPDSVYAHAEKYGVRFLTDGTQADLCARYGVSPAGNFWK